MTTTVTPLGEDLLNKANELVLEVQKEIFSRISDAENLALTEILRKLRQGSA